MDVSLRPLRAERFVHLHALNTPFAMSIQEAQGNAGTLGFNGCNGSKQRT